MGNIFGLMFNGVIVSISLFMRNDFYFLDGLIVDVGSFIRNIFNSAFTFNVGLLSNNGSNIFLSGSGGFDSDLTGLNDWLLNDLDFWLNYGLLYGTWLLIIGNGGRNEVSLTGLSFMDLSTDLLVTSVNSSYLGITSCGSWVLLIAGLDLLISGCSN